MLRNLSKILVVDNEEREIDTISEALKILDIPAHYTLYSAANPPKIPYTGIRLAFFDINLLNAVQVDTKAIYSFINALKQCIGLDNGPYILIFWSTHINVIEQIKEHINKREKDNVPAPILIDTIDKTIVGNSNQLLDKIRRILSNDILEILFDYESNISHAAGNTLKTIFNVVSSGNDSWGESTNFDNNFDLVFSNIAFETYGYKSAMENPISAVRDGLNPILTNELSSIELTSKWESKLNYLLKTEDKNKFTKIDQEFICKLNSIYHFNFNTERTKKTSRGAVVEFIPKEGQMLSLFGKELKQLRHKFLPFNSKAVGKTEKKEIQDKSQFVLLEISASCDYAQNNHRTHTYILGLLAPLFDEQYLMKQSDSIIKLPLFSHLGNNNILLFNSRYVITTTDESQDFIGDILFSIKAELLNKITTDYTNYISRLGVIQF